MTVTTTGRLLTVDEVAERLRLHRASVYRKIADGLIPAVRLGAHASWRIRARFEKRPRGF